MDSYKESWVPLCVTLSMVHSPWLWSHTLFRLITCIRTWIYVHLAAYVWSTPMHSLMETWVPLYGSVFVTQSSHFCCHTLFRMCMSISTWIYVYLTLLVWSTPLLIFAWEVGCPCVSLHVCPSHLIFVPTPCLDCVHASVHEFMSTWLLMSGPPIMHRLDGNLAAPVWQCVCVPVISFLLPHLV